MTAITARAPGKLIISGEHAVVHGYPALAIAINRYVDTTIREQGPSSIMFDLVNLPHKRERTLHTLRRIKRRVQSSYEKFLSGERGIRDVIKKPFELLEYTTSHALEKLSPHHKQGFAIHTQSSIPTGCGLGSSAATIISTNYALAHYLKRPISPENLLQMGLSAENMQHGKSSGLDLYMSIHGGCRYFQQGQAEARPLPGFNFTIVNTGTPESNTGECVAITRQHFQNSKIGLEFATVTEAMDNALAQSNYADLQAAVLRNHRLLIRIGVVPEKIQRFITALEATGAAAKICGAGAVRGDKAGIVLVVGGAETHAVCEQFGYHAETIEVEAVGVHTL